MGYAERISRGRRRAFTLLELLVVIAIIALLVAILVPSFRQARDLAKWSACLAHLKQVGLAMRMYVEDNNGYLTPRYGGQGGTGQSVTAWEDPEGWFDPDGVFYNHWYRAPLMTCWYRGGNYPDPPRNGDGTMAPYTSSSKHGLDGILSCPAMKKGPTRTTVVHNWQRYEQFLWGEKSYGMNFDNVMAHSRWRDLYLLRFSEINRPHKLMYMADGLGWAHSIYPSYMNNPAQSTATTPVERHCGNFAMVFCDGHTDSGPLDVFYQPEYIIRNWGE